MRKLSFLCITLILTCGLYASATHNESVLRHYILEKELAFGYSGLWPAAKRGDEKALFGLAHLAEANVDIYWLTRAASLNSLPAQLALAKFSESDQAHLYWLEQAAANNHAPSQFELYLVEQEKEKRFELLKQAADNQYQPAIIALGKYLYEDGQLIEALVWLAQAAEFDEKSRYKLARVQWLLGDKEEAISNFTLAGESMALAKRYADLIASNNQRKLSHLRNLKAGLDRQCSQQLQFIASSLDSAVQAMQFASKFSNDDRFENFPICINPLLWLQKDELQCELVNHRQQCNLSPLASQIHKPNYTHLVLFLEAGTAYVQEGVMHLDQADTYSVFIHELAHFVGFVDEYAVSPQLAQAYCESGDAPNLLIKPRDESLLYQMPKFLRWQQYSQPKLARQALNDNQTSNLLSLTNLRIASSRTCARLDIDTYKPSSVITFLEHHDTNKIPKIYLMMWRELLLQNHQQLAIAEAFYNSAFYLASPEVAVHWASYIESSR